MSKINVVDSKNLTLIGMQLDGCTDYEKMVSCKMAYAARKAMKENRSYI